MSDNSSLVAQPGSADFRDRDWNTYSIEMELIVKNLTTELTASLNNFILKVDYKNIHKDTLIILKDDSHFLNFNYTYPLQERYNIPEERITYIHGRADANNLVLILGQGVDPSNFVEKEEVETAPSEDWSEEKLEWYMQKVGNMIFLVIWLNRK